jgi:hypothetical protein
MEGHEASYAYQQGANQALYADIFQNARPVQAVNGRSVRDAQ